MKRVDDRKQNELRRVKVTLDYQKFAFSSCLIEFGKTRVLCAASVDEKVPPFLKGKGKGWLTAEYGMLPGSCAGRIVRESSKGRPNGRTQEIQRLIGRSLRAAVNLDRLGERTILIDCDVIQGDGGTRTASITGGFIVLANAIRKMKKLKLISENPILHHVAAVSAGVVGGSPCLDLCYDEDAKADVDMNVVMTETGKLVEIQGTAEANPFSRRDTEVLLDFAAKGIRELIQIQKRHVR